MSKHIFHMVCSVWLVLLMGCQRQEQVYPEVQVAFMADVHLQDIYGTLEDSDYKGVKNPKTGKYTMARTMRAQLHSTRIFNENYFAFLAALDDVAKRGVKWVVLPGDFSDDGQPVNIHGLKKILDEYTHKYGIRFIATTGNHDPVRPFSVDGGKRDFLGEGGRNQAIVSQPDYFSLGHDDLPAVVSKDIHMMGYEEIITALDNLGFFPTQKDVYWETPFSTYQYENYSLAQAQKAAELKERCYAVPPYQTSMPDVSYLLEPVEGLWFLALDANVYLPKSDAEKQPEVGQHYGSASIGHNHVLSHKKHLINWVKKVCDEAEKRGKVLIAFSHYPMVDFNDDATPHLHAFMVGKKKQAHRIPHEQVAQVFTDAGLRLHFGGHMHINDTGLRTTPKGNTLVNVQIPSLAAYIPAYKLLNIRSNQIMEVETIILDSVPRFNELFPLYEIEYAYLKVHSPELLWDPSILKSEDYHQFASLHLKALVQQRLLSSEWPSAWHKAFLAARGDQILTAVSPDGPFENDAFKTWTGLDMIYDFYRLRNADKLALPDIGDDRMSQYKMIIDSALSSASKDDILGISRANFISFSESFKHFLVGAPANHFIVNVSTAEVKSVHH